VPALLVVTLLVFGRVFLPRTDASGLFLLLLAPVITASVAWGWRAGALTLAAAAAGATVVSLTGMDWLESRTGPLRLVLFGGESTVVILVAAALRTTLQRSVPAVSPHSVPGQPTRGEPLTPREREILRFAATGLTVEEIAERLVISASTVKTHLAHGYAKLGVRNRAAAVAEGARRGYLNEDDADEIG
jgi:DNA-binding CsgD family transcriptional regulator